MQQPTLLYMTTLHKRNQSHVTCVIIGYANNSLLTSLIFFGDAGMVTRPIYVKDTNSNHCALSEIRNSCKGVLGSSQDPLRTDGQTQLSLASFRAQSRA